MDLAGINLHLVSSFWTLTGVNYHYEDFCGVCAACSLGCCARCSASTTPTTTATFTTATPTTFAATTFDPQQPDAADSQPSPQQPGSPQQPAGGQGQGQAQGQGQGQHDALRLRCQAENGTVPYWLDKTCRAYLSCTNFNLSMQTCEDGRAYSYPHRSCLNADLVNCSAQNEEFATIIRAFLAPHFYQNIPRPNLPLVPFAANNGGTFNGQAGDQGLDGVVGEEGEEEEDGVAGMTIDLDDLPSILVDTSNALNITLPSETCERLNNQTRQLETSINTALLMLIGCPERSCDVPLFRIDC